MMVMLMGGLIDRDRGGKIIDGVDIVWGISGWSWHCIEQWYVFLPHTRRCTTWLTFFKNDIT